MDKPELFAVFSRRARRHIGAEAGDVLEDILPPDAEGEAEAGLPPRQLEGGQKGDKLAFGGGFRGHFGGLAGEASLHHPAGGFVGTGLEWRSGPSAAR